MALWVCGECGTRYSVGAPRCPHCTSTSRADDPVGAVPPAVTTACRTPGCRYGGRPRRVQLRLAALGVVEIPTLLCVGCGALLDVAWPSREEENMPKVTVHGGPTNADEPRQFATGGIVSGFLAVGEDVPDLELPAEGGGGSELSSPGTSSTTSTGKPPSSTGSTGTTRSRARTTGSR